MNNRCSVSMNNRCEYVFCTIKLVLIDASMK